MTCMIRELKRPEIKSDEQIVSVLIDALREARENKVLSVTVTLSTKDYSCTTFCITPESTFAETIGDIEKLKDKVLQKWREDR